MAKRYNNYVSDDTTAPSKFAARLDGLSVVVRGVLRDYFYRLQMLRIEKQVCGPLLMAGLVEDFVRALESDEPSKPFSDALANVAPTKRQSGGRAARGPSLIPAFDRVL